MTIQYASDLHLEFPANRKFLGKAPLKAAGEVLVLGGDIVPFTELEKHRDFFDFVSDHFKVTYWLPGNHEYYRSDVAQRSGAFTEKIRSNVVLVNNCRAREGNVDLLFTTLWTRIDALKAWQIENGMTDFSLIRKNGETFSAVDYNELHRASLRFLETELSRNHQANTIVVTHHVPTLRNYPPQYLGSLLTDAFAVNLDALISAYSPAFWIYGHHHQPVAPFTLGKTTMLTNQLGYVQMREHLNFKRDCVVPVSGDM